MQVSVARREHEVGELVTQQHLVEGVDVRVAVEAVVGCQQRVGLLADHLQTQYTTMGAAHGRDNARIDVLSEILQ